MKTELIFLSLINLGADSIIANRLKITDQNEYLLTTKNLERYGNIGLVFYSKYY